MGSHPMREIMRGNDLVRLSFLQALLGDSGIGTMVADAHSSAIQGSLDILPRRLMVADEHYLAALGVLREAGELPDPT